MGSSSSKYKYPGGPTGLDDAAGDVGRKVKKEKPKKEKKKKFGKSKSMEEDWSQKTNNVGRSNTYPGGHESTSANTYVNDPTTWRSTQGAPPVPRPRAGFAPPRL
jgi:hypothetical protein